MVIGSRKLGRLLTSPRKTYRQTALDYGGLHVQMRQAQEGENELREHEARYVQDNIEATCRSMPPELRTVWTRALASKSAQES